MGSDISEPTSPKVTCAGQIKVKHKPSSCKNWQSVMEEIEKLHKNKKHKKHNWVEALGFKKDIMQFLTCLRSLRFRCFGSFPGSDITSDDEEDEEEEEDLEEKDHQVGMEGSDGSTGPSRTVFSKWFMVLQENQNNGFSKEDRQLEKDESCDDEGISVIAPSVPPSNALLLMRCRYCKGDLGRWRSERSIIKESKLEEMMIMHIHIGSATQCATGSNALLAEILAIRLGIIMGFHWKLCKVEILSDAKVLIVIMLGVYGWGSAQEPDWVEILGSGGLLGLVALFRKRGRVVGIFRIARDSRGCILGGFAQALRGGSHIIVEAVVVCSALNIVKSLGWQKVLVLTNAPDLVDSIAGLDCAVH
ncbi:hypothetical protein HHK36_009463 [Tetracentron sinense]|uniref:Uncharacterized protein n=1 Tax=Tetracentron sinense TaxID=13715 RepID=A0A834ZDF2_TETSI|nr:hypothetical protein HHK36_009463 [Tetracentron sinense]